MIKLNIASKYILNINYIKYKYKLINRKKLCCSFTSRLYPILLVNILSPHLRQCHCISLLYFFSLCDELNEPIMTMYLNTNALLSCHN